jgi:putative addiction module component (TIGR02574 family)
MPVTLESLGIDRLTVRERLELMDRIWDSLPESVEPQEAPEWHLVELARRRAEAEARPGDGRPWRDVLKALEAGS